MKIKMIGRLEWYLKICQHYQGLIVMFDCPEFRDPFAKIEFEYYLKFSLYSKINTLVIFTVLEI